MKYKIGKKKTRACLFMLALMLIVANPSFLSGQANDDERFDLGDVIFETNRIPILDFHSELGVKRTRIVNIDLNPFLFAHMDPSRKYSLSLSLFPDVFFRVDINQIIGNPNGSYSWTGSIIGIPRSQVIFVVKEDIVTANISLPWSFYQIRYAGNQTHAIHETDQSQFPRELQPIPVSTERIEMPDEMLDDGSMIDVLVVYTQAARSAAGGTTAMEALIDLAVTETNAGYGNSGVIQRLNLVHTEEVVYDETGFDWSQTLSRLRGTSDGYMDNVHSLRDTYGADEVALIVNDTGYCGIAYLMQTVSTGFADWAFAVVSRTCATGYYSFAHELGHNMGSTHDRANASYPGAYSYSYGYQAPDEAFRTIMAYNCPGGCTRVNNWSNPDVSYGGQPMGVVYTDPNAADNRMSLNNTAYTVANFRQSVSTFEYSGYLDGSNTSDTHSITLSSDGELQLHAVYDSTLDINYIRILDVDNSIITTWYPTSGTNSPLYGLKAGDYFIYVHRYSGYGAYTLTATFDAQTMSNDTEPNDAPGDANPTPNNGSVTGHIGYIGGGDGSLDDLDYYRVTIPDDGEFMLNIAHDSTLDIYHIRILDVDNSIITTWYPTSGINSPPYGLKAGDYFIRIDRYSGYGAYTLTTTYNAQPILNDTEPNDSPGGANPAPNNGSVTGHIGYVGGGDGSLDDLDYYRVTIPDDGEFMLNIAHDSTLDIYHIRILDVDSSIITTWYPTSGINSPLYGLKAGDYFIRIDRYSGYGAYTLTTTYIAQPIPNDTEPNGTPGGANPAPNNGSVTGHIGYLGGGDGSRDEIDYYRVTFPYDAELSLHITFDTTLNIYTIRIYDASFSLLATYYPTSGGTYGPCLLEGGDNYIRLYSNTGYGGYALTTIAPSIVPATITVTSPNGGENWTVGSSQNITWTSSMGVGDVMIEYSTDNGSNWSTIEASTTNNGTYPWTIPNTPSTSCLVRISEASDGDPADVSDSTFTIQDVSQRSLTISATPGGTTDPVPGTYLYGDGATVQITAIPDPTFDFSHWSGDVPAGNETDNPITITMDADKDITANFSELSPFISLSESNLNFGATSNNNKTSDQQFIITNVGGGTLDWSISTNASWLNCTPMSGNGNALITVSVNPTGLSFGNRSATIEVSSSNALNSPQSVNVNLNVIAQGNEREPFGVFDTPEHGSTVSANVPVTGWALDDIEVTRVQIKRSPHPDDNPAAIGADGLVFVGNAYLVKGARPDVEATFPGYPLCDRGGWGCMVLTNFFPGQGNGLFTLHAFAYDGNGHRVKLGEKDIYCDNANRTRPFGTIDTPQRGGVISGDRYVNFGWALTAQPKHIPVDGSTIWVWIDGVPQGHPNYGNYRQDIATKFPGYANSNTAVGHFRIDTTQFENGVHNISWSVRDSADEGAGIGARRYEIQNVGGAVAGMSATPAIEDVSGSMEIKAEGYEQGMKSWLLNEGKRFKLKKPQKNRDFVEIELEETVRLELHLNGQGGNRFIGWGRNQNEALPDCSTLDKENGVFYWMPEAGFLGEHTLHFALTNGKFRSKPIKVVVNIVPKKFK